MSKSAFVQNYRGELTAAQEAYLAQLRADERWAKALAAGSYQTIEVSLFKGETPRDALLRTIKAELDQFIESELDKGYAEEFAK